MDAEGIPFLVAGIVWLAFILVGIIGRPVKLSLIVSVGGGFLAAIAAMLAAFVVVALVRVYLDAGIIGLVIVVVFFRFVWILLEGVYSLLIGR